MIQKLGLKQLIKNQKQGFSMNTVKLWHKCGKRICLDYLTESKAAKDKWISQEWIKNNINRTNIDVRHVNKFFGLLAVEIWYRLFITNEMSSKDKLQ